MPRKRDQSRKTDPPRKRQERPKETRVILKLVIVSPYLNRQTQGLRCLSRYPVFAGEMGERKKKNKTRKGLNWTNLIITDASNLCHACKSWTHGHCAKVSKEQIKLLEQIESAMWFCDKCRCYEKSSIRTELTEFKAQIDQKLTDVGDLLKQTIAKHDETTEKLAEVVHEAPKENAKQIGEAQTNTSGASYARAWGHTNHTLQTGSQKQLAPQRNPEAVLIPSSMFNFRDSVQIKKRLAQRFPLKRLSHAFNTTRGNVHIEFASKEEADEVFEKRKQEFLGKSAKIRRALSTEKRNRAVIVKRLPLDVTDEMIQSRLDTQLTDAKATRFKKRHSTKLGTVKIVFRTFYQAICIIPRGSIPQFVRRCWVCKILLQLFITK